MSKETPLMKQYKEIKSNHKDSILFFRLGDFYEMFFDDAKIASKELGITLTSRNKEKGVDVPMAGVPFHSATGYINKLVAKGYNVAMCEQTQDPQDAKGIVRREVVKVITPGTIVDVESLDPNSNNYLMSLSIDSKKTSGIAYIDITTGEFKTLEIEEDFENIKTFNELYKIEPKELIIENATQENLKEKLEEFSEKQNVKITIVDKIKDSEDLIKDYFKIVSLDSFGITEKKMSIKASALALDYVVTMNVDGDLPIKNIEYVNTSEFMDINSTTRRNLELVKNQKEKTVYGSLLWILNRCKTSMGTRNLKRFINNPLINISEIMKRQDDLQYFIDNILLREDIKEKLDDVYDIERLTGKLILGNANGKDMVALKKSLKASFEIINLFEEDKFFIDIDKEKLYKMYELINESIKDDAPFTVREGNIIKRGYNEELDKIHNIMNSGKDYLLELESREKNRTNIKNLKIKYNKVFGYFIEISNSNLGLVPENYIRKQTLSNAERYITQELKEYENTIINSKSKIEDLEYDLFKNVLNELKKDIFILDKLNLELSYIDVVISFATVSIENNYVKPIITNGFDLEIKNGRHPVVEKLIGESKFISNDTFITDKNKFIILTGPNMAGKSTYMKQIALIQIMSQIGCYVPAEKAQLSIVDKVLTRIGASDDIVSGQSTFMVEMSEVANIINNATEKSLIILDEVGRGTSTSDGISIATAISEYIHDKIKAKTIFATHYHELTELENKLLEVKNYRIEVEEKEHSVVFLRKIVEGGADKSYGIEVARLAGLPKTILKESKKILRTIEKQKELFQNSTDSEQLSLFYEVKEEENKYEAHLQEFIDDLVLELGELDVNNMTPIEALYKLNEIKKNLEEIK